ncbi:MAG: MAPEG family protein, partial [Alphaproteobacteria bacterium]|nr:MAPEG family protein [Alphaproteobacteria bacterium]
AVIAHRTNAATAQATMTYFIARVVHFIVYTAGIPVLRTLAFAVGWVACLRIALAIFGF